MKRILLFMSIALIALSSCSNDKDSNEIKIGKAEYVINYEDEVQIDATSPLDMTYISKSEYIAKVSSSGLITGGKVGETEIVLSNGEDAKNVKVTIEPKHNLYPEPIDRIDFGVSAEKIKEVFGAPTQETATTLIYISYHSVYSCMFSMENGRLEYIFITVPTLRLPSNFSAFLSERYQVASVSGYTAAFLNENKDVLIAAFASDDLSTFNIGYAPFSANTYATPSVDLKEIYRSR